MEGSELGKYRIGTAIGRGAVGIVYNGWDSVLARKVAIKVLPLRGDDEDGQERRHRFLREAQALAGLHHPNIVGVFDYGETNSIAYIAMELITGQPLGSLLQAEGVVPAATARSLMAGLLAGLQHSHEHGIIHRDIKPSNIIVTSAQVVKITDFGIAHFENSDLTRVGTVMGTPAYMSPEQVLGDRVDLRTDLYSAGVILYQMLLGHRPFEGGTASIMHKIVTTEPELASDLGSKVPPGIAAVVRKALAKRADQRYQTAAEFAVAVERAMPDATKPGQAAAAGLPFTVRPRAYDGEQANARDQDRTVQNGTRERILPDRAAADRVGRATWLRPVAMVGGIALVLAAGGASFAAFRYRNASRATVIAAPAMPAQPLSSPVKYSDLPARPVAPAALPAVPVPAAQPAMPVPAAQPLMPVPAALAPVPAALPVPTESLDVPRPIPLMEPPNEPPSTAFNTARPSNEPNTEPNALASGAARGEPKPQPQRPAAAPPRPRSPPPSSLAHNARPDDKTRDAPRTAQGTEQSYTAWLDQQRRSHPESEPQETTPAPPATPQPAREIGSYVNGPGGTRIFQRSQVPD